MRPKPPNPALQKATCAALIAASFAVGTPVDAESVSSIERYCTTSWRQAGIPQHDWEDCTQDTMLELLSRLPQNRLNSAIGQPKSTERRELMRSIWCVSQRWRRASQRQAVSLDLLADVASRPTTVEDALADAELIECALNQLSAAQRQILELWGAGNSIAEISDQLEIPAARVSDQKYKAIRSLRSATTDQRLTISD